MIKNLYIALGSAAEIETQLIIAGNLRIYFKRRIRATRFTTRNNRKVDFRINKIFKK